MYICNVQQLQQQVWAACGTAIVSIAGMILFQEQKDAIQIVCLVMIVLGVVGLELRST
jgi:multidrug transporter EmrE-like cation transporter